jgi:hypothetical protein
MAVSPARLAAYREEDERNGIQQATLWSLNTNL